MNDTNSNLTSGWAGAGLLAAVTASLCCITPVLALLSGLTGIAATFSWIEPIRPFLMGLTITILGFAWYLKLKPKHVDEQDCACKEVGKEPLVQSKFFLGIVTLLAMVLLTFPAYSHIFYPEGGKSSILVSETSIHELQIDIEGMTCASCEQHVIYAAGQLNGVLQIEASYQTGSAKVRYDGSQVSKNEIITAINGTGYKITDVKDIPIK